eukprot:TRINITY_DN1603_c0_g1_i1.p1 TRINITY_DN1603_c0_g1~~TRINITY_DN1603_c0_g1_i1.p1  ORF type:complete len:446 (+),score=95.68 TRINITY_DN1603_c0_g1_i1:66-1403(+)
MDRAVVRMYFDDNSFKTFLLVPSTTAAELCDQVRTKLKTNCAYYLYAYPPQQPVKFISEAEKPWPLYKQFAEKCKFVFRTQQLAGVEASSSSPGGSTLPPRTPPPVAPRASTGGATPPPTRPSRDQPQPPQQAQPQYAQPQQAQPQYAQPQQAQPQYAQPQYAQPQQAQPQYAQPQQAQPQYAQPQQAQPQYAQPQQAQPQFAKASSGGGGVTADDFDALLDQLTFDVGAGGGGGGGGAVAPAGGGAGASMFGDPFGGFDLTATAKPQCSACGQPILRNQLTAFGMQWHKEHLACAICKRNFLENDVPVVEGNDGKAYCQTDYLNKFAPKCTRCTKPIAGECTNALGKQWHPACFVCKTCSNPFSGTFFEHEGNAYCEKHYYDEKGLICPECERPIIGKCITAKGKRYHPQHFVCSHCKKKLGGNEYFYHDSKLFCKGCSITFYG